jgi:predicted RNase H-like nuclease (RuvC/YqgF family)
VRVTWESLIPVIITVGAGLLLWGIKIAITAIGNSITRELDEEIRVLKSDKESLQKQIDELRIGKADKESLQKQIDNNTKRIDFLIEKLIERNS